MGQIVGRKLFDGPFNLFFQLQQLADHGDFSGMREQSAVVEFGMQGNAFLFGLYHHRADAGVAVLHVTDRIVPRGLRGQVEVKLDGALRPARQQVEAHGIGADFVLADEPTDYTMPVRIAAAETETARGFHYYRVEHRVDNAWVGASLAEMPLPDTVREIVPNVMSLKALRAET